MPSVRGHFLQLQPLLNKGLGRGKAYSYIQISSYIMSQDTLQ